jgi:hypothetical protein
VATLDYSDVVHYPRHSRFQATAETLKTIAADPQHLGAEIGFLAVLHTLGTESALRSPRRRPLP